MNPENILENSPENKLDNNNEPQPGFFRRYRLPIVLGIVAVCLYVFSIGWIVLGR